MDVRVRLRPWLESRLNEGCIDGVCWLDREKGIFKIPWKHHSKHTWKEGDAAIFKDWAMVTGKYRPGIDDTDWPMWKTRLRCALNKAPDIQEVKQRHDLHCDEPFKVYRFISKTESLWRANAARNASMIFDGVMAGEDHGFHSAAVSQHDDLEAAASSATLKPRRTTVLLHRLPCSNSRTVAVVHPHNKGLLLKRVPVIPYQLAFRKDRQDSCNMRTATPKSFTLRPSGFSDIQSKYDGFVQCSPHPSRFSGGQSLIYTNSCLRLGAALVSVPSGHCNDRDSADLHSSLLGVTEPEFHQLGVRIQHLNFRVKDTIVTNPNGCCIYYGRYDEINSPAAPDPIETQIPHHVLEANKEFVDLLLENMIRGVVLSVIQGSIYAERMCKCAVFVYSPVCTGEHVLLKKLGRRERELIFDYSEFMSHLRSYRAGQRPKPHFEVILAFGQQLKLNSTTSSLLVWCRVASCRAWFQLNKDSPVPQNIQDILRSDLLQEDAPATAFRYSRLPAHFTTYPDPTTYNHDSLKNAHYPSIPSNNEGTGARHTLNKVSSEVTLVDPVERDLTRGEQVIEEAVEVPLDFDETSPLVIQDCLLNSADLVDRVVTETCLPDSTVPDGLLPNCSGRLS